MKGIRLEKLNWKFRLAIVLSLIWLGYAAAVSFDYDDFSIFFLRGAIPVGALWGGWWVVTGFFRDRAPVQSKSPRDFQFLQKVRALAFAAALKWRLAVLYFGLVIVALFIADQMVEGRAGFFAGEAVVYSLIVLVVLLVWPKSRPHALTLTIFFLCASTIFNAYQYRSEQQKVASLVERVAPLFAQIQKRIIPTDQEVKKASLGEYEPIMLEMVRYSREIESASQSYQQSIKSVGPLLTPQLLGTDSGRSVLSSKIKQFETALRQLEQVVESSTNNYKERLLTLGEKFSPQGRAALNQGFMRGALLQQEQFRIFFENQNSVLTNFQNIAEVVTKFKPTPGTGSRDDLVRFVNPYAAILFKEHVQKGFALAQREQEIASGIESSTAEAVRRFQGGRSATGN